MNDDTSPSRKSPSFQFYPNDWLSSTAISLMTPEQEGAYIRLLCHAWNSPDCGLPDDEQQLSVLARIPTSCIGVVMRCFKKRDGRLYNLRLLQERKKQEEWRKKSSLGGKKGSSIRWGGTYRNKGGYEMVITKRLPNDDSSSSSSSSVLTPPIVPLKGDSMPMPSTDNPPFGTLDKHPKRKGRLHNQEIQSWFDSEFWPLYPRRIAKENARSAADKVAKDPEIRKSIIEGLKVCLPLLLESEEQFRPHPATWLNGRRWEDEHIEPKPKRDKAREELHALRKAEAAQQRLL